MPFEEYKVPTLDLENPENLFVIKDSEVTVTRIYTDEELEEIERNKKILEEEERKKNLDDYLKRGSLDMMNDTLDTRKGLKNKKKGLEREEWMDGDPNDFTEEQKKL